MTREQDFERRLADWLEDGPVTAPGEVVERSLDRTAQRRQLHGARRWLRHPLGLIGEWFPEGRLGQLTALTAVLVGMVVVGALLTIPQSGDPGPAPGMDPNAIRAISGAAPIVDEAETQDRYIRTLQIDAADPRVDGTAEQRLVALLAPEAGMYHWRGTMRLENDWGAWEGSVDVIGYPTGEEAEMASLTGAGAYTGYTYLYAIDGQPSGTERAVEGAIWPDEPPLMPDPSLLP